MSNNYPIDPSAVIDRANEVLTSTTSGRTITNDDKFAAVVVAMCEAFNAVYEKQQNKFGDLIKLHEETINLLVRKL